MKDKNKSFIQPCELGGSMYGKAKPAGHKQSVNLKGEVKKEVKEVYSKFYKNQLEALYKVIHKDNK